MTDRQLCCMCGKNKRTAGRRCRGCQRRVNEAQKARRKLRQAAGMCGCGRNQLVTGIHCEQCRREQRTARNVTHRNRRLAGLCLCGQPPVAGGNACQACRDKWKERHAADRLAALTHYGLACECCGEDTYEFLEIDHVNGNGNDHRRSIGYTAIYRWLIKNNFPDGFQTLCSNCNRARFRYGVCPHQRQATLKIAQ